ncbi:MULTISPECIES: carboxypeptidase-like regulatory domain-containing protein [unclassified Cupriavidus]|uniref:carboxypeptidase-like regulatory domain-containing protein n=1 Tax=unclassified Cupriavidus TaxID=2640874 RepID=UPI000422308A|nr:MULTISPECIES: carboxypeptidase-like regulatory domain-containing protein [unclassified Cupriavidus]MBP0637434.1 carboxypeptidase regulatory-like domain-containing protein [Cupriavidus sp. AcVe19-6a]
MNRQRVFVCRTLLLVALLCAGTAPALAQPDPSPAAPRPRETVRAVDLLTEAERADICARLRSAASAQERQTIMQRTFDLIATRASERGITLRHDQRGHTRREIDDRFGMECSPRAASPATAEGMPAPRVAGDVRYLTGGVGQDEAAYLRKAGGDYTLRLTFTGGGGQYLAGVDTQIFDSRGRQRFAAVSDGPFLFVQLPPGRYRVVATADGKARELTLVVPGKGGVSRTLHWASAS